MKVSTLAGGLGFTGLANIMAGAIGAPWWALLTVTVLGIICTTVIGLAQVLMPHESHDKVLLWNGFWEYRERRRTSVTAKKRRAHRAVGATARKEANVIDLPRSGTTSERTPARSP
ncbi:hypothetical protein [Micromonospora sp. NPDC048063]|uniref:hypothetical protein n=1 Tax=Micromonospora sp. NPDC048063 TaxID=3364256 RepID=UPI00371B7DFA